MGQAEIAVIAVLSFAAGFVFRHTWPLFVAWQEDKLESKRARDRFAAGYPRGWKQTRQDEQSFKIEQEAQKQPPRRRLGLAEMRARKESESFKPLEHQAQVTANNIAAMEGK